MTDRRDDDFHPSAPKNRGPEHSQGTQAGGQGQQRQVGGAPSWRRSKSAGSGSGPAHAWDAATRRRASRGRSSRPCRGDVTIKNAAAQSAPSQPAVACPPALYRARCVGRDGESGQDLRAADRCRRPRCVQERCADDRHHFRFILSPEDGAELETCAPRHLMGRMEADLWQPRLCRQSLEHRQPARTSSCAGATPAKTSSSRATTSPMGSIAPPNWRPNGWARAELRSSRPCGARWIRSGGRAWIAPKREAGDDGMVHVEQLTNPDCNASVCC